MRTEIRVALRTLVRRPAFALAAITTLGVGIGATTSIFSTVNATLLRPLPFSNAHELYTLRTAYLDGRFTNGRIAGAYLTAIAESAATIERAVAVVAGDAVIRADDGRNRRVLTQTVEAGFFELFGLPPVAGHIPGQNDGGVAVLSYRLWDEMFGRDPEVIGRALRLTSGTVTIAGVASAEFDVLARTDIWFNGLRVQPNGTSHNYDVFLRSRSGVTPDRLRAELTSIMSNMGNLYPATASGRTFIVTPVIDAIVGDLRPILLILLSAAIVLLALACVNVAMLIVARGAGQTKELAVRTALGAHRGHIVRLFLTESFALASAGTAVGLVLALACIKLLHVLGASELPRLEQVPLDGRVLLFAIVTLAGSTALVGLMPAIRMANPSIRRLLSESGWSTTGRRSTRRLLSGLVVAEIALATTLVTGAGWLGRSYLNLAGTDPGFDPRGRLFFDAQLFGSSFAPQPVITRLPDGSVQADVPPDTGTPALWLAELTERLTASDQITAVGAASSFPFQTDWDGSGYIGVPGEYSEQRQDNARWRNVSPGFFEAMGIHLIAGRTFENQDSGPVVVVNEEFVQRYFPGRDDVVGATFAYGLPTPNFDNPFTILGVVADVKYRSLAEPAEPILYVPRWTARQTVVIATTLTDPTPLIPLIRAASTAVDADRNSTVDA